MPVVVNRSIFVLILGYLGAFAWAAYEWQRPVRIPETPITEAVVEQTPLALPTVTTPGGQGYPAITERPLFQQGRRPSQLMVEEPQAAPVKSAIADRSGELKAYRLTAVVKDASRLIALIESSGNETKTIRTGDRIGSWEASDIYDDRVVLVSGTQQETLVLRQFEPPRLNNRTAQRTPAIRMRRNDPVTPPNSPMQPAVVRAEQGYPAPSIKDPMR